MIPPSLRPKMWAYNHGNRKAPSGPLSSQLVLALYPEGRETITCLRTKSRAMSRAKRRVLDMVLWRLGRRGLVVRDDEGRYMLTDLGRWFAIARSLGVSFIELCVLACACCVQARYARSGMTGFYMRSSFEKTFGEYYSEQQIKQAFSRLRKKGFATRHAKKTLQVYPVTQRGLMRRYGPYLRRLESWVHSMQERETEVLSVVLEGFTPTERSRQVRCKGTRRPSRRTRDLLGS